MGSLHSSAFSTQSQKIAGLTTQQKVALVFHFGLSLDLLPTRIVLWTRALRTRFLRTLYPEFPKPREADQPDQSTPGEAGGD